MMLARKEGPSTDRNEGEAGGEVLIDVVLSRLPWERKVCIYCFERG